MDDVPSSRALKTQSMSVSTMNKNEEASVDWNKERNARDEPNASLLLAAGASFTPSKRPGTPQRTFTRVALFAFEYEDGPHLSGTYDRT